MCGRFTLTASPEAIQQAFPGVSVPAQTPARYNIAPTQPVAVIPNTAPLKLDFFVWGLIPSWSKDPRMGARMINARAETLAEKPSFRAAYRRRRCLIPADGFYEWQAEPGSKAKTPMYIRMNSEAVFAFAGLWEEWHSPEGDRVLSCTIITTEANDLLRPIHERMPVILPAEHYEEWLLPEEMPPARLDQLLRPYDPEQMHTYAVSREVNSPANDSPGCVVPA